jgi:ubiquinone/menaquinone biosynthesis C-methylase UbiE
MADVRDTWSERIVGRLGGAGRPVRRRPALRGLRKDQQVRYVAADISLDMLARARRRAFALGRDGVEFVEADIERMPFGDNEFDLCVSFNGLHCLSDPAAAVREIVRCLRTDGRLVGDAVVHGAGWRVMCSTVSARRRGGRRIRWPTE